MRMQSGTRRRRLVFRVVITAVCAAGLVAGQAGGAAPGPSLETQARRLETNEHEALLTLYALDSRVEAAQSEVTAVQERLANVRRRQSRARLQLRVARRTVARAEARLGQTLVALYEGGGNDPIAVIFGARSFADAVDGLDGLTQTAASHAEIAAQARDARRRVAATVQTLRARAAEVRQLVATAEAELARLARARAERAAYLARIRAESAALARRLAAVEARARAAQARAQSISVRAAAAPSSAAFAAAPPPPPPPPEPQPVQPAALEPAPVQPPPSRARTLIVTATAYSARGTTSTGLPVGFGIVAVDPTVIPLGTRMTIPGYGEGVAADTGPGVQGAWIDVWLPTAEQAAAWGTKTLTITLH
jgi:3D (Asp-Asp-Asp) domain-containing protein/peptidoglycan hydrolase CwlO-like protein